MKVLPLHCKRLDLRVARMTTEDGGSSPVGDVKIVPPISTFVRNTLTRKLSAVSVIVVVCLS